MTKEASDVVAGLESGGTIVGGSLALVPLALMVGEFGFSEKRVYA